MKAHLVSDWKQITYYDYTWLHKVFNYYITGSDVATWCRHLSYSVTTTLALGGSFIVLVCDWINSCSSVWISCQWLAGCRADWVIFLLLQPLFPYFSLHLVLLVVDLLSLITNLSFYISSDQRSWWNALMTKKVASILYGIIFSS